MENATRFLKQAFNIREGRAPYHVIRKRFVNGARLTGSHLCILIIAMLIASIGLDIDSDIAIVGAMLICPLMGSVLAMAYGIATLDREIAVEAIAGLALQMVFCLITSTLYFKLSPLGTTTAAIIDNSTPTVWDLAVALAGGFAGGLGNSRDQEPATLIAGVAVATALMPPLCAAGYGIAIASGSLFLSALYEFGINVVFIALAAEAVLLLLRVPLKRDLNGDGIVTAEENAEVDELSHKVRRRIIVGTVIFAIPCIVMTAGSIGSAQAGVQDGYGVTETTRELAAVLPGFKDGSVRPGLTFRPIIFLRLHNDRPLVGFESDKGATRPRPDELLARSRRFMPTCRLTRRLPVGRRRLDPHLERHPALSDERPEKRIDGGGHGQPELVQDDCGLFLDLRFDADRRGRYVRRHGCTFPRISRCNYFIVSMRRMRPSSPYRAAGR